MSAVAGYVGLADAIEMIESGRWDSDLKAIKEAVAAREEEHLGAWRAALKPGFKVRVTESVSPKWMAGRTGEVTAVSGRRYTVRLDYEHTMRNGRRVSVLAAYASHLEPVDG